MKILMAASEATPLAKTGGLADVVHALSRELVTLNNEVAIVLPYYQTIREQVTHHVELVTSFTVYLSWRKQVCNVYKTEIDGITYYLLSNHQYFGRDHYYGYYDDLERFAFFTLAIRILIKEINFKPDVIHCHDWQVGMLPCLIREQNMYDDFYRDIKFVLTIHNPAFQGLSHPDTLGDYYSLDRHLYDEGKVRFKEQLSTLKAGLIYADKITTVSITHAEELYNQEKSHGLETIMELRRNDFVGIVNGIDYEEFDPSKDHYIDTNFNKVTFKAGKEANKKALYKKLHLRDTKMPLFAIVSRLTWQKGLDLVLHTARALLDTGSNLVILGTGEAMYEQEFENLRQRYPSQMGFYNGYSDELAHQIYAACDIFLMPSLFEPCGIGQMIALRYGALPLVRMTGGLKDTVTPYFGNNIETANGFGFYDYDVSALHNTISWALTCFENPLLIRKLRQNALRQNNDWLKSASEYLNLYHSIVK